MGKKVYPSVDFSHDNCISMEYEILLCHSLTNTFSECVFALLSLQDGLRMPAG